MRKLEAELGRWGEAGLTADLWWRDDDAGAPRPELTRLLDLTQNLRIPLHLSVIPAAARTDSLAGVGDASLIRILQHGWSHANHEPGRHPRAELGDARPRDVVLAEVAAGIPRLTALFGAARVLPVLVPPWNTLSAGVAADLCSIGVRGVSGRGPRTATLIASGVVQVNVHADLIDWRREPRFLGAGQVLSQIVRHLRSRRRGTVDPTEPTGIMTHHWAHDTAAWDFLERLGRLVNEHPAARWTMPNWTHAGD